MEKFSSSITSVFSIFCSFWQVNAKLSDYGISAFATEGGLTQEIGTPGFKAPELLKAKSCKMPYDEKVSSSDTF